MTISTQQSFLLSRLWFSLSKTIRILGNHSFLFPAKSTYSTHPPTQCSQDPFWRRTALSKTFSLPQSMAGVPYCQNLIRFYGTREDGISLRPVRKARPSLRVFSRNLQTLDSIMCRSVVPNFATFEQRMSKLPTQLHSRPQTKYGFHCTTQLTALRRNFLYRVSYKSGQPTKTGRF
jgi:hypothetical protein